jgi:hypothetical protein
LPGGSCCGKTEEEDCEGQAHAGLRWHEM